MTFAQALKSGFRLTHQNPRLLWRQVILNAVTLGLFYFFLQTPETTIPEVIISALVAGVVLFLFLLTQAGTFCAIAQASTGEGRPSGFFRQGLYNSWRFLLVTLPVALLGYLLYLGQNAALKKTATLMAVKASTVMVGILWCVILPLILVTLWTAVARHGLSYSLKNGLRFLFLKSFGARTVLVYITGFVLFALAPYFLIAMKTPMSSAWLEFITLVMRLLVSYLLIIYGWTITAGAITSLMADGPQMPAKE